ncbi:MAG: hypothetical protein UV85_C0009G0021 [Candidatus Nomurabacteria bacterium GW2011_GWB1_43_19]|nr:MAG: hypothetical protein UV85_C0009G0021 [Candidatus Nomurabacteria bacterium GW2011_GWB1_43_19]
MEKIIKTQNYKLNMKGFNANIEKESLENKNFRKVLYTGKHSQLVLMSLKPKEDIGTEIHPDNDQFFRVEKGQGRCLIDGNIYSPAHHQDGVVRATKAEAEADGPEFDGKTTEQKTRKKC